MQRVDVVVPCYNYARFLQECVESVLGQSDVDVRVLILDDASSDHTADLGRAMAARDERVIYRRHEVNRGHIATYNEGIEWAGGDFFLLLSADDYLLPGAFGRSLELMGSSRNVGFTFGNALVAEPDGTRRRVRPLGTKNVPRSLVLSGREFFHLSGATNIVPTPTAVVRTALQKRVGAYRLELPHSGDMEMWLRLAVDADVGFINEDQAVYRKHGSNMSSGYCGESILPDLQQRRKAFELLFQNGPDSVRADRQLQGFLRKELGMEALRQAGRAFNESDLVSAEVIERFALDVSPDLRNSLPWARLALKRAIGPKRWQALKSIRSRPPDGD